MSRIKSDELFHEKVKATCPEGYRVLDDFEKVELGDLSFATIDFSDVSKGKFIASAWIGEKAIVSICTIRRINKTKLSENSDFYEKGKIVAGRTQDRLKEIEKLDCVVVGFAQFGIPHLFSGLFIEKVWGLSQEDWDSYINWVKELKEK